MTMIDISLSISLSSSRVRLARYSRSAGKGRGWECLEWFSRGRFHSRVTRASLILPNFNVPLIIDYYAFRSVIGGARWIIQPGLGHWIIRPAVDDGPMFFVTAIPHSLYLWFWLRLMPPIRPIICKPTPLDPRLALIYLPREPPSSRAFCRLTGCHLSAANRCPIQ